jgi:hypothetical protein
MENKKILGVYSIIHNDKIQSLRSFLNNTKQMYDYQKINLSNSNFISYLKRTCYDIEVEINSTNAYYESNKTISTEIGEALEKCKDLSVLFLKYITELNELGIDKNEYLSFRKEIKDAFDFDLEPKKKKEPVENHLEIAREFKKILGSIKIETSIKEQPQQTNDSETPKDFVFKNNFDKVKENTIIEYFKTNLVEKKHISETVLYDFLSLAFDKKTLPIQKFSFEKLNTQNDIVQIFYNYYKTTSGKPYGKQKEYLNLLCNYFNGFENFNIKNFSK